MNNFWKVVIAGAALVALSEMAKPRPGTTFELIAQDARGILVKDLVTGALALI
jgi:hypothetical protein